MKNGGYRPGSGRKKGSKANLAKKLEEAKVVKSAVEILGDGQTPLEFLISEMRDQNNDKSVRIEAAKGAMTYCHRKQPEEQILNHRGEQPTRTIIIETSSPAATGSSGQPV